MSNEGEESPFGGRLPASEDHWLDPENHFFPEYLALRVMLVEETRGKPEEELAFIPVQTISTLFHRHRENSAVLRCIVRYLKLVPFVTSFERSLSTDLLCSLLFGEPQIEWDMVHDVLEALQVQQGKRLDDFVCSVEEALSQVNDLADSRMLLVCLSIGQFLLQHIQNDDMVLSFIPFDVCTRRNPRAQLITRTIQHSFHAEDAGIRRNGAKLLQEEALRSPRRAEAVLHNLCEFLTDPEDDLSQFALATLWDVLFKFPHLKSWHFDDEESGGELTTILEERLDTSDVSVKRITAIGLGRMCEWVAALQGGVCDTQTVLHDTYQDYEQGTISILLDQLFVHHPSGDEVLNATLLHFFKEYAGDKEKHQKELANSVVFLTREGVVGGFLPFPLVPHEHHPPNIDRALRSFQQQVAFLMTLLQPSLYPVIVESTVLNLEDGTGREVHPQHVKELLGMQ